MTRAAAITHARTGARSCGRARSRSTRTPRPARIITATLESVIYVVSGRARMRWGDHLEFVAEAGPGRFHLRAAVRAAPGDQRQPRRAARLRAGAQRPGAGRRQPRHRAGRDRRSRWRGSIPSIRRPTDASNDDASSAASNVAPDRSPHVSRRLARAGIARGARRRAPGDVHRVAARDPPGTGRAAAAVRRSDPHGGRVDSGVGAGAAAEADRRRARSRRSHSASKTSSRRRASRPSTDRRFTRAASARPTPRSSRAAAARRRAARQDAHHGVCVPHAGADPQPARSRRTRRAAAPADRRRPSRPAWCRSRSARRPADRCCGPPRSAASPDSRPATACSRWKACCRSRRASTRSASSRIPPADMLAFWECAWTSDRPAEDFRAGGAPTRCPTSSRRWRRRFSRRLARLRRAGVSIRPIDIAGMLGEARRRCANRDVLRGRAISRAALQGVRRSARGHGRPGARGSADAGAPIRRGAAVHRRVQEQGRGASTRRRRSSWCRPPPARRRSGWLNRRFAHERAVDRAGHAGHHHSDAGRETRCRSGCSSPHNPAKTPGCCGPRCGSSACWLLPPRRSVDEAPRGREQIVHGIGPHARQPDQDARIVDVVVLEIVHGRIVGNHLVALREVDADDERVRLRGLVRGEAGEQLVVQLQRGRSRRPCRRRRRAGGGRSA